MTIVSFLLFLVLSLIYISIRKISITDIPVDESILDQSKRTINKELYLPKVKKILMLTILSALILGVCISLILVGGISYKNNIDFFWTAGNLVVISSIIAGMALLSLITGLSKHIKLKRLIDTNTK